MPADQSAQSDLSLGQINDRAKTMNTNKLHTPLKPWSRIFATASALFPVLVCAAALGAFPAMAQPAAANKAVTAPVTTPSIEGKTIEGKPFALSSLKGKVVLVMYWSTGCAVCRDKMPELRTNYSGWAGKPFELVAISTDARMQDVTDYEQIITRTVPLKQRFVQLWTGDASYRDNLGKHAQLPAAYLVDKSGKIVERYVGRIPAEAWDRIADLL